MRRLLVPSAAFVLVAQVIGLAAASTVAAVGSPNLVISQVYGGGGLTNATYTNDFVEIFNRGSTTTSLSGWSLQYASATGSSLFSANVVALPNASVPVGGYFLVQLASGGAVGSGLPTPDAIGTVNMGVSAGKVILTNSTVGLDCNADPNSSPCPGIEWMDLVGYGLANGYEGSGPAPATSASLSASRAQGGCVDTDDNAADFTAAPVLPRNSASPTNACSAPAPTDTPAPTADSGAVAAQVTVPSSAACIELSTSSVGFGTLPLGAADQPGTPDITVTNCSGLTSDIYAHASDASGAGGAAWSLVDSMETCADTLGIDHYRLGLEQSGTETGLGATNKLVESLGSGLGGTQTARIFTACPGSTGSGTTMSMTITFLATTAGG